MHTVVDEGGESGSQATPAAATAGAPAWPTWLAPAAVAGVVAVGLVARFVTSSPLWLDEALSANIARLGVGDMLDALRHDGHPPLYYLLLHGWMQVFGESDGAVRALSGVFSVATLPLAWIAGRRLAGVAGGRWALVVFSLSPYSIRYATETRMYSLVMLLVLAGYLLVSDALRAPTRLRLAAIAAVSGLLLLTHYWSIYLLAAVGVLLVVRWRRSLAERPATQRVLGAVAAGGVLFLPWLGGFLYQAGHTGTPWGEPYRPTELVQATLSDMGGGQVSEALLAGALVIALSLLALLTVRSEGTRVTLDLRTAPTARVELILVALTAAIGTVAGYATSATYQSRYAAVFVPLLLLVVAVGITRVPGVAQLVVGAALAGLSLAGIVYTHVFDRTQAGVVADAVAARAEPGDVVVYCPDQLGPAYSRAVRRAAGGDLVELSYPLLSSPVRVDWVDYADRNAAADPAAIAEEVRERADGHAVFVVWMSEYRTFGEQCEELVNALGAGELLVTSDGQSYYEPANLHHVADVSPDGASATRASAGGNAAAAGSAGADGP